MKRALAFGFLFALLSSSFAACTMNFDQFQASGSGTGGTAGTAGSGGTTGNCNGGCCTALDCPAPQDPCKIATCVASTCGETARQDGTSVDMQTAGDCKKAVCMGGAVTNVPDDGDVLSDNNACTTDTCSGGNPSSMPTTAGTACDMGNAKLCDGNGNCVECLADKDCPAASPVCDMNTHGCIPATCGDGIKNGAETDKDCGGGQCSPCDTGQDCNMGSDCKSQVCNPGGKCEMPKCNDGVQNGTETDKDCGGNCQPCQTGQGCNQDQDCVGGQCTGMNGTCVPTCTDGVLNNGESDIDCGGNNCNGCDIGQDCAGQNSNCLSNYCDANNKCANKDPNGTACMTGATCDSGNCTDMVCCASQCMGTCRACNLPGSVGTCMNIAAGQDPAGECGANMACNGNAGCDKVNGQTCAGGNDCVSGNCVDTVCCATTCVGLCKSCNVAGSAGTCTNIPAGMDPANECTGTTSCDGSGACLKLTNGTVCTLAGECQSGNCVDGVCCDNACGGLCKACNVAGSVGTCSNVPAGTDPAMECADPTPNCNGSGACN